MKDTNIKKLFYNFKDKKFIGKDFDFNMHDNRSWISFEEKPSRKKECHFLGEMSIDHCGEFNSYVIERERIGPRDPEFPELTTVLEYFKEWNEGKREAHQRS
jgi:hypothetical protein